MNELIGLNEGTGEIAVVPQYETAATAAAAQAKAVIEARYVMAERHPRDLDVVRGKMLKECQRPRFAAVARYNKPIGKGVQGPSIRFVEMALRCMANVSIETATIFDDDRRRIMRVSVTDLENNVTYPADVTLNKTVERSKVTEYDTVISERKNSYGKMTYTRVATDDEILDRQNALISKAIRTLGLRIIPGDIVDECQSLVVQVWNTTDAGDPEAAKKAIFDSFLMIGISVSQIKEFLGHNAEMLAPKELADLRGLYTAINDGSATWDEATSNKELTPDPDGPGDDGPGKPDVKQPEKKKKGTGKGVEKKTPAETGNPIREDLRALHATLDPETANNKLEDLYGVRTVDEVPEDQLFAAMSELQNI